jgi:opacity protein-like surface antigen
MSFKRFLAVSGTTTLAFGFLSGFAPTAHAQWYVSGNVGTAALSDAEADVTGSGTNGTTTIESDTGYGLSGALGYSWGSFRLEGELSYRENDLDQASNVSGGGLVFPAAGTASGETSAFGFMVNGWYDFQTGSKWVPYIGGGIGGANINLNVKSVGGTAIGYDESDTVVAFQAGAGVGYRVTPRVTFGLSYRLFGTLDPKFDNGVNQVEGEYLSHNFMAGVRVAF